MGGLVAGLDVGTTSIKLSIYDEGLNLVREHRVPSPLRVWLEGGYLRAVQPSRELLLKVGELVGVASEAGARALGISVYRASVAAWLPGGRPVSDVVTWLDQTGILEYEALPAHLRALSRLPGLGAALKPGSPLLAMRRLARERGQGARVWTVDALISEWLGCGYSADPSSAALTGVFDPRSLRPLPIIPRLAGLGAGGIPSVAFHGECTCVNRGVNICSIIADQQAASVGLGCLGKGCLKVSMGTGFFLDYGLGERVPPIMLPEGLIPVLSLRLRDSTWYGIEGFIPAAGMFLERVLDLLGLDYDSYASLIAECGDHGGLPVFPVPAGSRSPYKPLATSAIIGVGPSTGVREVACGAAIGLALAMAHVYSLLESVAGRPVRVVVTGGASRLRPLVGYLAGFMGRSVEAYPGEASARGAAALAAYASGVIGRGELLEGPGKVIEVGPIEYIDRGMVEDWLRALNALGREGFSRGLRRLMGPRR